VCVLCSPVNLLLSQNNNISLRGLRKSARRRACVLERAWRCFRYEDIDHILKSEHECTLLRLSRTMASIVIFHYTGTVFDNAAFKLQDASLYIQGRKLDLFMASEAEIKSVTSASYTFTTQRNGNQNKKQ
jgi:hypothetical protein